MTIQPTPELQMLTYRVESLEREVTKLSNQLASYVPIRENDLKLQNIQDTVKRIESEVGATKNHVIDLQDKLNTQQQDIQTNNAKLSEAQNKLVIRTLYGAVSFVLVILSGVLIAYFTHLIH